MRLGMRHPTNTKRPNDGDKASTEKSSPVDSSKSKDQIDWNEMFNRL